MIGGAAGVPHGKSSGTPFHLLVLVLINRNYDTRHELRGNSYIRA